MKRAINGKELSTFCHPGVRKGKGHHNINNKVVFNPQTSARVIGCGDLSGTETFQLGSLILVSEYNMDT